MRSDTWHVSEHLLLLLSEARWVVGLLELTFNFSPLAFFHGLGHVVRAGSGRGLLRDDPGGGWFRLGLANVRGEVLRLHHLHVGVVVLGRWVLRCDPFSLLREMHSLILAI